MEKTIVKGDFFIIPNRLDAVETKSEFQKNQIDSWNRKLAKFGLPEFKDGDMPIQIWATSQDCDNWDCHFKDWQPYGIDHEGFVYALPARILCGLKEGQELVIDVNENLEIRLTAAQGKYRYANYPIPNSSFESMLQHVIGWGEIEA